MASGIFLPTTAASSPATGTPWSVPSNALVSDDAYATASLSFLAQNSDNLTFGGFDFSAIPADATITGIAVHVEGKASTAASINWCELLSAGVLIGTRDNADKALTTSDTVVTYGGSGTLWGGVGRADLDPDFGVQFAAKAAGTSTVSIDALTVEVYWTPAAPVAGLAAGLGIGIGMGI